MQAVVLSSLSTEHELYNTFLSIGVLKNEITQEEETFKLVSERLEKAFFVTKGKSLVFKSQENKDTVEKTIKEAFKEMELVS